MSARLGLSVGLQLLVRPERQKKPKRNYKFFDKAEPNYVIYGLYYMDRDHIEYIGITTDPDRRLLEHLDQARKGRSKLSERIRACDFNFKMVVLHRGFTKKEAFEIEKDYINRLDRLLNRTCAYDRRKVNGKYYK